MFDEEQQRRATSVAARPVVTRPNRFEWLADRYRAARATPLAAFAMRSATAFGCDT